MKRRNIATFLGTSLIFGLINLIYPATSSAVALGSGNCASTYTQTTGTFTATVTQSGSNCIVFSRLLPITQVHLPGLGLCLLEPFQFSILLLAAEEVLVEELAVFSGVQEVEAGKSSRALPLCQETLQ